MKKIKLTPAQKQQADAHLKRLVAKMPPDMRKMMREALETEMKCIVKVTR